MLLSFPVHGSYGLAGSANVQQLQQALVNLAIATNRPAINPGAVTGVMNDQTVVAVSSALGLLTEQLPSSIYLVLQAALLIGSATAEARKVVEQYAPQLTIAANTAAVKYHTAPPLPVQLPASPPGYLDQLFAPGWYTKPMGIVIIGISLFVVYKLFIAKPTTSTAAAA